jgi:hypothetical protein
MEKFLNDYGLKWIGFNKDDGTSNNDNNVNKINNKVQ